MSEKQGRQEASHLGPQEIRTTRLLLGITVSAATVLALIGVIVFHLLLHLLRTWTPPPGAECREGDDPDPCVSRDMMCIDQRCVPDDVFTRPARSATDAAAPTAVSARRRSRASRGAARTRAARGRTSATLR